MTIATKNFDTLVSDQVAAIQAASSALIDFTDGSILRAVTESNAAQGLFLESRVLQVAALTRAATSNGADLDSFVGDFGLTREPAVASTVRVTFSRFTPTNPALVPVGTRVQTADGTQTFGVVADPGNPAWSPTQNGFVIAGGASSVTVTAVNTLGAAAGNVVAGSISLILSAVPGVDTVTNSASAGAGSDAETDPALRIRFQEFIASLASATPTAIGTAVASVQPNLTYSLVENQNLDGSPHPGFFYVTVDDGSGDPPGTLLDAVGNAIDAVRATTVTFAVFGPIKVTVNVVLVVTLATGFSLPTVETEVQVAITTYINSLGLGASLPYTRVAQVAYSASPGVTNVTGLTLNGATADITATPGEAIRAGSVSVT